jgi:predicted RNase H-like nuclease (RuvC/YqgF family)
VSQASIATVNKTSKSENESLGQVMAHSSDSGSFQRLEEEVKKRKNLEAELETIERTVQYLPAKNPNEALEMLTRSLAEERDKRQQVEARLAAAQQLIENLTDTRETLEILKTSSQVFECHSKIFKDLIHTTKNIRKYQYFD